MEAWQEEAFESLKRIASRYEIPPKVTDDDIDAICSKLGSVESIWGFCTKDLTGTDFTEASPEALYRMAFNNYTEWPASLDVYDYKSVLQQGKKPGLDVDKLHARGIDGTDVNIAVIDKSPILASHTELVGRIKGHINCAEEPLDCCGMDFHGMTCAGIACGNTMGVATGANLYYYYPCPATLDPKTLWWSYYFTALDRIHEHNKLSDDRINIVSISAGIPNNQPELLEKMTRYQALLADEGCHVIWAGQFGKVFTCSSRVYGIDPDSPDGYKFDFWQTNEWDRSKVLVPAGGRTSPCNSGVDNYIYRGNQSCYSRAIPYVAGVFALALQINNELSYDDFCTLARETATKNIRQQNIICPLSIMDRLATHG